MHGQKQFVRDQGAHTLGRNGPERTHEKCGLFGLVGELSDGFFYRQRLHVDGFLRRWFWTDCIKR